MTEKERIEDNKMDLAFDKGVFSRYDRLTAQNLGSDSSNYLMALMEARSGFKHNNKDKYELNNCWFYVKKEWVKKEFGLNYHRQDSGRKILLDEGIIKEKRYIKNMLYFKFNSSLFNKKREAWFYEYEKRKHQDKIDRESNKNTTPEAFKD